MYSLISLTIAVIYTVPDIFIIYLPWMCRQGPIRDFGLPPLPWLVLLCMTQGFIHVHATFLGGVGLLSKRPLQALGPSHWSWGWTSTDSAQVNPESSERNIKRDKREAKSDANAPLFTSESERIKTDTKGLAPRGTIFLRSLGKRWTQAAISWR